MKTYKTTTDEIQLKKVKSNFPRAKITSSKDAFDYVSQFYGDDIEIYESMFLVLLNNSNNTIGFVKISSGGMTATICDVRLVCKYAIETLATAIILCHNHPSGLMKESKADIDLSKKVQKALQYFDIRLLDHLILAKNNYLSMSEEGLF